MKYCNTLGKKITNTSCERNVHTVVHSTLTFLTSDIFMQQASKVYWAIFGPQKWGLGL